MSDGVKVRFHVCTGPRRNDTTEVTVDIGPSEDWRDRESQVETAALLTTRITAIASEGQETAERALIERRNHPAVQRIELQEERAELERWRNDLEAREAELDARSLQLDNERAQFEEARRNAEAVPSQPVQKGRKRRRIATAGSRPWENITYTMTGQNFALSFTFSRDTPFRDVIEKFAGIHGLDPSNLRLAYGDKLLDSDETAVQVSRQGTVRVCDDANLEQVELKKVSELCVYRLMRTPDRSLRPT